MEAVSLAHAQEGISGSYSLKNDEYEWPYALLCDALREASVQLLSANIVSLRDGIFFSELALSNGEKVSARPSDCSALALWVGAPILVTTEILDEAGVIIEDEQDDNAVQSMSGEPDQRIIPSRAVARYPLMSAMRRMEIIGVRVEESTNKPLVLLHERQEDTYLPIWISVFEASAIAFEQEGTVPARPLSHDLFCDVLNAIDIELLAMIISEVTDEAFLCDLAFSGGKWMSVRPGDAIALAIRTDATILVSTEVLNRAGVTIPPDELKDDAART
jgi:bifunctional DNase/RNase